MVSRNKKVGTPLMRAKAKRTLGKRKGQSKGEGFPFGYYVKGGILHRKSLSRDRKIKAKTIRKKGTASWRGDKAGSWV